MGGTVMVGGVWWWMVSRVQGLVSLSLRPPRYSAVLRDTERVPEPWCWCQGRRMLCSQAVLMRCSRFAWETCVSFFPMLDVGLESWSCSDIDKNCFK